MKDETGDGRLLVMYTVGSTREDRGRKEAADAPGSIFPGRSKGEGGV